MAAPAHELVGVATARLRNYAPLTALVGASKVFYKPDAAVVPPYVVVDDVTTRRADVTCLRSTTADLNIHIWTDTSHALPGAGGPLQDARAIAYEVAQALHDYPLALPTKRMVTLEHRGERIFYDTDGTTGHGVVEFSAIIEGP
ncbi:DUF3168 domain-containing protein [Aminobacter niigataensis]|uniref:DUF3168 domain-containing protein n=1 Tax=Aminobacter niigataensis TaxID=83265 RepID=UPI0024CA94BE|nr:DUF3168 domain-containing protein [Aminobacter niigataensis]CAI2935019.1 conserved protein of unknown function [Aminobacter niigataensis]